MAPLPKRAALEKANGASAMFNTGMLQYQQALASMQFQQQAAFLPSGMAPKATTASALTTQRISLTCLLLGWGWTNYSSEHCGQFILFKLFILWIEEDSQSQKF